MKVPHGITRLATTCLIFGALAAPAATARPAGPDAPYGGEPVVLDSAPVVHSADEGFDWPSAAVGAGAAAGLVLLLGVGHAKYRKRDEQLDVAY